MKGGKLGGLNNAVFQEFVALVASPEGCDFQRINTWRIYHYLVA